MAVIYIVMQIRHPFLENQQDYFLSITCAFVNLLFASLAVVTTCFRLAPIRKAPGIQPRVSALAGSFLSLALAFLPMTPLDHGVIGLALLMMIVGTALSFYVLLCLGTSFSVMAEARRLVTGGPYRVVRHPLYLCEMTAILGALILHFSELAAILIAVQFVMQFRRMANEEAVLRSTFPEYAAYAAAVPRFIPFGRRLTGLGRDFLGDLTVPGRRFPSPLPGMVCD